MLSLKRQTSFILAIWVIAALSGCKEQIVHDLSEAEAIKIISTLGDVSINAERVKQADSQWALAVPSTQSWRAVKYLTAMRMLPDRAALAKEKLSVIAGRDQQRFHLERSISRELQNTLSSVPGVLEAKVHINLPVRDPIFGQALVSLKGSASVLLLVRGGSFSRKDIAALVAGAAGVAPDEVSIMISQAADAAGPDPSERNRRGDSASAGADGGRSYSARLRSVWPAALPARLNRRIGSLVEKERPFFISLGISLVSVGALLFGWVVHARRRRTIR